MMDTDAEYISLSYAYKFAKKALRSPDYAAGVLKRGMAEGQIKVKADTILEEFACGSPRPFNNRRLQMQIAVQQKTEGVSLSINTHLLRREPKGAQVLCNWKDGHIAWVAPLPTRFRLDKVTGKPRAVLPTRTVMYNVEVEASSVNRLISKLCSNNKISTSLLKVSTRNHFDQTKWRKLFPDIYALADDGRLDKEHNVRRRGGKAALQRRLQLRVELNISLSTAKRIATVLMDLDAKNASEKIQEQQQQLAREQPKLTKF